MRRIITIIVLCAIALAVLVAWIYVSAPFAQTTVTQRSSSAAMRTITLDGQTIRVSVADTQASRALGLGGRSGLAPNEGMLFVFSADDRYAFWMKDMKFSIDIVWLSANGTVVYILPNLSPATYPQAFAPTEPARYVLELPADYTVAHGVKVGDVAQL